MTQEEQYMAQALALAEEAAATGDIPVGCVVVKDGVIIGQGRNRREETGDATAHAEVEAIRHACAALGSWAAGGVRSVRDPGAMPHVRWGYDQRPDSPGLVRRAESQGRLLRWGCWPWFQERFNHRPQVCGGVLEEACAALLHQFFRTR